MDLQPLEPGDAAPTFTLPNIIDDSWFSSASLRGRLAVVVFWSPECHWCADLAPYFTSRHTMWDPQKVTFLLIASNSHEAKHMLREGAHKIGYEGLLLRDKEHTVANAFGAMTTPHSFIIDRGGMIVYQGGVNDRTFYADATHNHLDAAVEALLAGIHPDPAETPAYGCAIIRNLSE